MAPKAKPKTPSGAEIRKAAGRVGLLLDLLPAERDRIKAAAKARRQSVNQFVIGAALEAAEKVF